MAASLSRFQVLVKSLRQLGFGPLGLYALYRFRLWTGHYRRLDASIQRAAQLAARPPLPLFTLPSSDQLAATLSRSARAALLRDADLILTGKVRIFGDRSVLLQLHLPGPLQHWTAYEKNSSVLARFLVAESDLKFLWEPARFTWTYTLGRAFQLNANEKFAQAFWRNFEQFESGSPSYLGPHWMNGQEVAIRLMALLFASQVFANARSSTSRRLSRLACSIARHAARIPSTLTYARSQANNHLITESTALYLAGSALDHRSWRELGWRWLNYGLQRQIGSYGEYIQHSTNYHRLMLQSVLLADMVRRGRRDLWPARTQQALSRASHWLFSMIDPASGKTPNLGANDGSLILPLSSSAAEDYRPTVQAAARAFLRTGLAPGDWDELALWLGLPASKHTADSVAYAAEHLRGANSWAYLRASSFKSRLSHMDQLHLDLWWNGINLACDAGTYSYNAASPWDNPLVSTRVHNTVMVDGCDQMTRAGRFLTLDWAPAYSKLLLSAPGGASQSVMAYHRAYRRLGVRHERYVSLLASDAWTVKDLMVFEKPGRHTFRLHWLLIDGEWRLDTRHWPIRLRLKTPRGWMQLEISLEGVERPEADVSIVRAGRLLHGARAFAPYEGWVSPTYGRKVPAISLTLETSAIHTCSLNTTFIFPE